MQNNLVSVNMVVFNGAPFIAEALQSILDQTYDNFELIIVDDASTDDTLKIVESFHDSRIKIIKHDRNRGSLESRITALNNSSGKYIAILDADDISMPNRLEIQQQFLEKNTQYGLVGGIAEKINKDGKSREKMMGLALSSEETMVMLLFKNCFIHSCVMYRKSMIDEFGWDGSVECSEDFQLITDISTKMKIINLPEIVGKYRKHDKNLTNNTGLIKKNSKKIILKQLLILGLQPSNYILENHMNLKKKIMHEDYKLNLNMLGWLDILFNANKKKKFYPEPEFYDKISGYWLNIIDNPSVYSLMLLYQYYKSPIMRHSDRSFFDHLKFSFKCLIRYKPKKGVR